MDAMSQDFNFGEDYKSQAFYGGLEFGGRDGFAAPGGEFATQAPFRGGDAETQPASQADFGAPSSQSFSMGNGDFMSQVSVSVFGHSDRFEIIEHGRKDQLLWIASSFSSCRRLRRPFTTFRVRVTKEIGMKDENARVANWGCVAGGFLS